MCRDLLTWICAFSWKPATLEVGPVPPGAPTWPWLGVHSCQEEAFFSIYADNLCFPVLFPVGLQSSQVSSRTKERQQVSVRDCATPSAFSIDSCHLCALCIFEVWESLHSCCTLFFITKPAAGFLPESGHVCNLPGPVHCSEYRRTCEKRSVIFVRVSCVLVGLTWWAIVHYQLQLSCVPRIS